MEFKTPNPNLELIKKQTKTATKCAFLYTLRRFWNYLNSLSTNSCHRAKSNILKRAIPFILSPSLFFSLFFLLPVLFCSLAFLFFSLALPWFGAAIHDIARLQKVGRDLFSFSPSRFFSYEIKNRSLLEKI